ncbi:MAG TPA: glycosyltransferase family 2 protein [Candidatus Caenarcaniphilales bacterium]
MYEDAKAASSCIQAIHAQTAPVDCLFIVDNSKTQLFEQLDHSTFILHCPANVGVAQGLVLALDWATAQGYDFLWAFDQDSRPDSNCLKILLETYQKLSQDNYQIGIIAPAPIDLGTNQVLRGAVFEQDHFLPCRFVSQVYPYECDAPITSGSLISITAAKTISPPRADLFIDGVDFDYGLRLKHKGLHNLIVPKAIMYHSLGNPVKAKFLQQEVFIQRYSALRHYYICRNYTYLATRYAQRWYRLTSCLRRIKHLCSLIGLIVLFDPESKALKVWASLIGTVHGLQGKLGKTWH